MNTQGRKILFISLSRTGSVAYSAEMAKQMSILKPSILCSEESKDSFDSVHHSIPTYTGAISFVFQSIIFFFRCPAILNLKEKKAENTVIYFPVFHPWNLIISIWAGIEKIKVITTIHDYDTHTGEKNKIIEFIQKRQMDISDRIVFLTENEKLKALRDKSSYEKKSIVLGHPILNSYAKHLIEHFNPLKFLFLGRLHNYKGYQLLIKAANNQSIKHITIAGKGELGSVTSQTITVINKYLDHEEIARLIESHHILVLPYIDASQSGIITLGIDAGIPMIVSKLPGLQEQLHESSCLWIEPNGEALENAMLHYQNDLEYFNTIKKNINLYKIEFQSKWLADFQNFIEAINSL